jgi:hypothetical protein
LRNNLKREIRKISKWRAPIKNQNREGPNLNFFPVATVPIFFHGLKIEYDDDGPIR